MPNLEFFWVRYFFLLLFPLVVWQKNPPTANKCNVILSQSCQYLHRNIISQICVNSSLTSYYTDKTLSFLLA